MTAPVYTLTTPAVPFIEPEPEIFPVKDGSFTHPDNDNPLCLINSWSSDIPRHLENTSRGRQMRNKVIVTNQNVFIFSKEGSSAFPLKHWSPSPAHVMENDKDQQKRVLLVIALNARGKKSQRLNGILVDTTFHWNVLKQYGTQCSLVAGSNIKVTKSRFD